MLNTEFDEVSLERTDMLNAFFRGKQLAHVSEYDDDTADTRWTDWTLYEVQPLNKERQGILYILYRQYHTIWRGEKDVKETLHFRNIESLVDYFYTDGHMAGSLRRLFTNAGFGEYLKWNV